MKKKFCLAVCLLMLFLVGAAMAAEEVPADEGKTVTTAAELKTALSWGVLMGTPLPIFVRATGDITLAEPVPLGASYTIDTSGHGGNLLISGVISGAYALTVNDTPTGGIVILAGANTYTGRTMIAGGGRLLIASGGSVEGDVVVEDDSTLAWETDTAHEFGGDISGAGSLSAVGGALALTGALTHRGDTTVETGATLELKSGYTLPSGSLLSVLGTLKGADGVSVTLTEGAKVAISAGGLFVDQGTAFTATTQVTVGAADAAQSAGGLSAGAYAWTGTAFEKNARESVYAYDADMLKEYLAKSTPHIIHVMLSNNIDIADPVVLGAHHVIDTADSGRDVTISGVISGNFALTVNTVGKTVRLAGANTYTGVTTITQRESGGGQLVIGPAGSVAGDIALEDGQSKITWEVSADKSFDGDISGSGNVWVTGRGEGGTLALNGALTHTGGIYLANDSSRLVLGRDYTLPSGGMLSLRGTLAGKNNGVTITLTAGARVLLAPEASGLFIDRGMPVTETSGTQFTVGASDAEPSEGGLSAGRYAWNGTAFEKKADAPALIPVESVTVTGDSYSAVINTNGGALQLSATVLPENADDKTVTWSITNGADCATINPAGLLTATADGAVTVRATANDGSGKYGELTVTIVGQTDPTDPDPTDPNDPNDPSDPAVEQPLIDPVPAESELAYAVNADGAVDADLYLPLAEDVDFSGITAISADLSGIDPSVITYAWAGADGVEHAIELAASRAIAPPYLKISFKAPNLAALQAVTLKKLEYIQDGALYTQTFDDEEKPFTLKDAKQTDETPGPQGGGGGGCDAGLAGMGMAVLAAALMATRRTKRR